MAENSEITKKQTNKQTLKDLKAAKAKTETKNIT